MVSSAAKALQTVGVEYAFSILLCCCAGLFVISVLTTVIAIRAQRKNDSLVELLQSESERHTAHVLAESERHTSNVLSLSERLNNQYYMHQEKVSIEHIATLRSLLDLLPTHGSETSGK